MADYTEHYQLHQWQPQDPFLRTDFNTDLAQIDKTLNTLADKSTVLEAAVALCGSCSVETFTYDGTGTYGEDNPTIINFSKQPVVFMIWPANDGGGDAIMVGRGGDTNMRCFGWSMNGPYCEFWSVVASWNGGQLRFYHNDPYNGYNQLNYPDTQYLVIAFYNKT